MKRALESPESAPTSPKKACTELDALKSQIEALMQAAVEKHEDIRIAAVDHAYDAEVQLREKKAEKAALTEKLETARASESTASQYLDTFKNTKTLKMLEAAENCTLERVRALSEPTRKLQETLRQLEEMHARMSAERQQLEEALSAKEKECTDWEQQHASAEAEADTIAKLNEFSDDDA